MVGGPGLLLILLGAIVFIVLFTAKVKWHPFIVLLLAAYGVGLAAGMEANAIISAITSGFGGTLGSIGIVIAAGTIIGFILEKSGAALVMANSIIKLVGESRSALAMAFTGGIVSIPVFCDSGFVILSPLNRSLAARSKQSLSVYAIALSLGLYATHVFVPPTPGPIAAAGTLNADLGIVILLGLVVSIPSILAGYLFAKVFASKIYIDPKPETAPHATAKPEELPSVAKSFAPILVPVILIALKSIADYPSKPFGTGW
ncbi:MAG TPA: gluconate transporter, partial [Firmicutes bacterium]|nr:gluconate transporter [Bacillota bacterium]